MNIVKYLMCITGFLGLPLLSLAEPKLNGLASYSQLGNEQFLAAVYATSTTEESKFLLTSNEDKRMELKIISPDLFTRRFQRIWIESIAINSGPPEQERHAQHLADFLKLIQFRLVPNDQLSIERLTQQKVTRVSLNGHTIGSIQSVQFFDLLLRTWVGPVPISSEFRNQLLANGKVDDALIARFTALLPTNARVDETLAWIQTLGSSTALSSLSSSLPKSSQSSLTSSLSISSLSSASISISSAAKTSVAISSRAAPPTSLITSTTLFNEDDAALMDDDQNTVITAASLLNEQLYISKLNRWTSKFVKYPSSALKQNLEGSTRLSIQVDREGKLLQVTLLETSGYRILDDAAIKAVHQASPYPAMPNQIAGKDYTFSVPVAFRIAKK